MTGHEPGAAFDRALPFDEEERQARRRRDDGRGDECRRDGRNRARQAPRSRIDRTGRAARPEQGDERGERGERDGRPEALVAWRGVERERELERGERSPVRELDRRDAANEQRERRLARRRPLGLRVYR